MEKKSILIRVINTLAALGVATLPISAAAQTNQWQGTDSDWGTATNWSLETVPAEGEDVEVTDALGGVTEVDFLGVGTPTFNSLLIDGVTVNHAVADPLVTGSLVVGGAVTATYHLTGGAAVTVTGNAVFGRDAGASGFGIQNNFDSSVSVGGDLVLGELAESYGEYSLMAGGLTVNGRTIVGAAGEGLFTQASGLHTTGELILGQLQNSTGRYELLGGTLSNFSPNTVIVGDAGTGVFDNTGGTHNVTGDLILGNQPTGDGTYNLSGGGTVTVNGGDTIVGNEGTGTFNHIDGDHTTTNLHIAKEFGSVGSYVIDTGTLNVATDLTIGGLLGGGGGTGSFVQNGGTVDVLGGFLIAGGYGSGTGSYTLNDGTLASGFFGSMDHDAVFEQAGGTHTNTGRFIVGNTGSSDYDTVYNITGPTAVANFNDLIVGGFGRGILNQSDGTVNVAGELRVGDGPNIDPTRRFGEYNLSGGALVAGNDVIIGVGNSTFAGEPGGLGTFNQDGGSVTVTGAVILGGAGSIGGGTGTYNMIAGTLTAGGLVVGQQGGSFSQALGTFNQSGGDVEVTGFMTIGEGPGSDGEYQLSGGTLNVDNTIVGGNGTGLFRQTGGTYETVFLNVGGGGFSLTGSGEVRVEDGSLVVGANLVLGNDSGGYGLVNQTGGSVAVNDPTFGVFINNGDYNLGGGTLTVVNNVTVGDVASGSFSQSGGILDVGKRVTLGSPAGVTGNFTMTGGTATVGSMRVGDEGTGVLALSGSAELKAINDPLNLFTISVGRQAGSTGSVTIGDSAKLEASGRFTVGEVGTGSVTQGGTSTVTVGGLRLGNAPTATGTYTLDGGTLMVTSGSGVEGGSRIGLAEGTGVFHHNGGTHLTPFLEIGGASFGQGGDGTGTYNMNGGSLVVGGSITIRQPGNTGGGVLNVAGGTVSAPTIVNNDQLNYSGGSIAANVTNNKDFNVTGGAARTLTGSLTNNAGGTTTVAASTPFTVTGALHRAGGSIVADSNIVVGTDYTNTGFGSGNGFDRRAGVTGAGVIQGLNASQTISAPSNPLLLSGSGPEFTLDLGVVRGGSSRTAFYRVDNNGTGASIRGAIQTSVNGGNITDGRLTGSGVTAGNFGPIVAGGNSGGLAVTLNGTSGGALSGQKVAIYSNFDNVATQVVNITGAATTLATGNATPNSDPVNLGNFRVGGTMPSQSFEVTNQASGAYAERLGIAGTPVTTGNFGATNNLGAGFIDGGTSLANAVTAQVSGGTAGVNAGSMTIQYQTNGTLIDPSFTTVNSNSQTINLEATGYVAAAGNLVTGSHNFATIQVGQTSAPFVLSIQNTATGPNGFVEDLNARFGTVGSNAFGTINTSGQIDNLAAGSTNNSSMSVSITGTAAGTITDFPVPVNFYTAGTVNGSAIVGLSEALVGSADFLASANVILSVVDQAKPVTNGVASPTAVNVNLGNVRVGGTLEQTLSVLNQATGNAQAALNASIATNGAPVTASGGFNLLLPGNTNNTDLKVGVTTGTAGAKTGTATISFVSDASNIGNCAPNCEFPLASQTVNVSGNVYLQAQPDLPAVVNLGNVRVGSASQAITIGNTDVAGSFQEGLNASTGTTTGQATASGGPIVNLAAGATSNAISVGLTGIAAGTGNTGTVQINLASNGTASGLADLDLPSQTVTVNATGYRLANPTINNSPITIAARVGDAVVANQGVSIANQSPDIYTEGLKVTIAGNSGNAQNNGGSIANLAAMGTDATSVKVGLASTASAGLTVGTVTLNMISTGAGTTGAADESLGTQNVTVNGKIYTPAVAQLDTPAVNFGIVRVGDVVAGQSIGVTNAAAVTALNDTMAANMGAVSSPFSGSGGVSGLGAGQSGSGTLVVGLNTAAAGVFNGTASVNFLSQNPDMADLDLGSQQVALSGTVNDYANPVFGKTSGAGGFSCVGLECTLDFGNVVQGGTVSAELFLQNLVADPADDLDGAFALALGAFIGSGFDPVNDLAPGGIFGGLDIDFAAVTLGLFEGFAYFDGFSVNASDPDGVALDRRTLRFVANVIEQGGGNVPEPGTIALVLLAAALMAAMRRQRRTALH